LHRLLNTVKIGVVSDHRYHHGDLPNALLDAAEALIRERGSEAWSLREVSSRVGVSPSAAYHHFASRNALIGALSARVFGELGTRLQDAATRARGDNQARLVALGASYVNWALEDPAVFRLTFGAGRIEPATPIEPHPHDVLVRELDRLVDSGDLPAAARPGAETAVWAAVHGLATLLADGIIQIDDPQTVDRSTERFTRATLTGLAQETPQE
jgi:AcrR family transcriptional regulator